jgi:hypothetical protein
MTQDKAKGERTIHYRHLYARELERTCRYVQALMYGGPLPEGRGKHRDEIPRVSRRWIGEYETPDFVPAGIEPDQAFKIIALTGGTPAEKPFLKRKPKRRFLDDAGEPEAINQRTEFTRE